MKFRTDTHPVKETGGMLESNSNAEKPPGNMNNFTRHINCCLVPRGDILRIICNHRCHSKKSKLIANLMPMSELEFDDSKTGMGAR